MRETQALGQKLAVTDLERLLQSSLANGSVCQYIVNTPAALTFDSTAVSSATPQTIKPTLPIYASYQPGPPSVVGPVVAMIGQPASSYSNLAIIKDIQLSISGAPNPLPPPGPGVTFTGNWQVILDSDKLVRALPPISVSTTLAVDTTVPTQAKITGCQSYSGGANCSFNGNGYCNLPGGLIIQWGTTPPLAWTNSQTISFPTPFPNQCFSVNITPTSLGGSAPQAQDSVTSITSADFTWYQAQYGSVSVRWMAVGW